MGPDPRGFDLPAREHRMDEIWAEHGWGLTGWQTGLILAGIVAVCVLLKVAGG